MSEVYRSETGPQEPGIGTYGIGEVVATATADEHSFSFKTETLHTAPPNSTIWHDYTSSHELGIDDSTTSFNIWIDRDQRDREDNRFADLDIPREVAFELHAWLTERLYG